MCSPVITISEAILEGMNAFTLAQIRPPGSPLRVSVMPNLASSDATIMSDSAAMTIPAPKAYPWTAAMIGFQLMARPM